MPPKQWITPAGILPALCADILSQPHALVAGATGSGKSTVLHALLYTALYNAPPYVGIVLIDPKRVELRPYAALPHTLAYADTPDGIAYTLARLVALMDRRYAEIPERETQTTEKPVYVFIDEFADVVARCGREAVRDLEALAYMGRAAGIHLILCTQRPTRDVISGKIAVNIDSRLALRVPSAQDSRNLIHRPGAEALPMHGNGLYASPAFRVPILVDVPFIPPEKRWERVDFWLSQMPAARRA